MEILVLLRIFVISIPQIFQNFPFVFGIFITILALNMLNVVINAYNSSKELKLILRYVHVLRRVMGCFAMFFIAYVFMFMGEMVKLEQDMISDRFLFEMIIVIAISTVFVAFVFIIKIIYFVIPDEVVGYVICLIGLILLRLAAIGAALLFIYTDAEILIQEWGFLLVGKPIGQWIYSAYLAWLLSYLFGGIKIIIDLTLDKVFGDREDIINDMVGS